MSALDAGPAPKRSTSQAANLARRLRELRLRAEYHLLSAWQSPFGPRPLGLRTAQARIADRLANWGSKP